MGWWFILGWIFIFFHVWEWACCNPQNNWVYKASHIPLLTPQKLFCNISSCIYSSILLELAEVIFFHKRYGVKTALPCLMFQYYSNKGDNRKLVRHFISGNDAYWLQEIWTIKWQSRQTDKFLLVTRNLDKRLAKINRPIFIDNKRSANKYWQGQTEKNSLY